MSHNPFSYPVHTWGCPVYHGAGECNCWMVQCCKCKYPGDRLHWCYCLLAEEEEAAKWSDWEEIKRQEDLLYERTNPELYGHAEFEMSEDAHYAWYVNRGYERDQQKDTEERFGG